ncbi:MAG: hypothetical protein J7K75_10720 [Desulfuromonas sp.]|nr:hypothetical protein [Desulfuromonas sp.]
MNSNKIIRNAVWLIVTNLILFGGSLHAEQLPMIAKNPATWQPEPQSGQGLLDFSRQQNSFAFSADHLQPHRRYALIQHRPGHSKSGYIIVVFQSDVQGCITAGGQWNLWQGKIWLVPVKDVRGEVGDHRPDQLTRWNPHQYLFEDHLL